MEGRSKWRFKLSKTSAMKNSFLRNNIKVIADIKIENIFIFGYGRRVKETRIPSIFSKPTSSNPMLYILMFSMRISDQITGLFEN